MPQVQLKQAQDASFTCAHLVPSLWHATIIRGFTLHFPSDRALSMDLLMLELTAEALESKGNEASHGVTRQRTAEGNATAALSTGTGALQLKLLFDSCYNSPSHMKASLPPRIDIALCVTTV